MLFLPCLLLSPQVLPARQLELNAMREAVAGQSASVTQLGKILEECDGQSDEGGFVSLPVGRVPPAAVSSGTSTTGGVSIAAIAQQAKRSFLPPDVPDVLVEIPQLLDRGDEGSSALTPGDDGQKTETSMGSSMLSVSAPPDLAISGGEGGFKVSHPAYSKAYAYL